MASETTHAVMAPEHYVGMPQLNFDWFGNQIFWLVVTLVVIYFVLVKVAIPRISTVLAERHGAIQGDLDKAEELKAKAVAAEEAYTAALAKARAEAGEIVAAAKADIQKDLDVAIAKADAEIAAKAAESDAAIKEIRDGAMAAIKEVATDTAGEIVKTVMPAAEDAKAIKAAVADRLKG